jgi:hypothetical protein
MFEQFNLRVQLLTNDVPQGGHDLGVSEQISHSKIEEILIFK